MDPKLLPEFVHDLSEWTRRSGGKMWSGKAAMGSPFYWPSGVADPGKDAQALGNKIYDRMLWRGGGHEEAHMAMTQAQQESTLLSYCALADYHAQTLEQARLFYIGRDISYLAARTEMREFRLDPEMFRFDPLKSGSLMTCGFMMWDTPIGEAEPRGRLTAQYSNETGELLEVNVIDDVMDGFRDSETPVNALTWRILTGAKEVLVVFYSDGSKARENYERHIKSERANLRFGMRIDEDAVRLQLSDVQPLEREQVLPLNTTLAWFEDKDREDRLRATILSDPSHLRAAERNHVLDDFVQANEKILPMLSQMVKTFVATLAVRRMKLASRQEIPPPGSSRKRMRRDGASEERQSSPVQLVRIGTPIKRRGKGDGGSGGGKWKVKTIIGPVIRTRQYVPAHDEYRDGVWMIEPYIAGPRDAPWSEKTKVFLLDGSQESTPKDPVALPVKKQEEKGTVMPSVKNKDGKDAIPGSRNPKEIVKFSISNEIADFIFDKLPTFGWNAVEYYESIRVRGDSRSTFEINLYSALTLHVEIGHLFDSVIEGDFDVSNISNFSSLMEGALDAIEEVTHS